MHRPTLAALGAVVALAACTGTSSPDGDEVAPLFGRPPSGEPVPPPTLAGGLELAPVDPSIALTGEGIAYGSPLPSAQAAAQALLEDPGIVSVVVRLAHDGGGVPLAEVVAATLDGSTFFDGSVLDAYLDGLVAALAGAESGAEVGEPQEVAGTPVRRLGPPDGAAVGLWRIGDLVVIVRGGAAAVDLVLERSLAAVAAGEPGSLELRTPLPPPDELPPFVEVPTVDFVPLPPAEDEEPPESPVLIGAGPPVARIGVVGGERRAMVWAYPVAPEVPTLEAVRPAVEVLVQDRAGGAPAAAQEVLGRVVIAADGAAGARSARAFLHRRWVLVVEGRIPGDLDGIVSAWISAL